MTNFNKLLSKKRDRLLMGFTLIELLVVIAIIGVLGGIVIISMGGHIERARITAALSFSHSIERTIGHYLVGRWSFDEGAGTTVYDRSPFGNHGTIHRVPVGENPFSTNTPYAIIGHGHGRYSLSFDGADDYVEVPFNSSFDVGGIPHTVLFWFKLLDPTKTNNVFLSQSDWNIGGHYNWAGNQAIRFHAIDSPTGTTLIYGDYAWTGDTGWHFTGQWFDGTTIKIIFDGEIYTPTQLTAGGRTQADTPLYLARHSSWYGNLIIDEVRIYNRALSAKQIQDRYVQGLEGLLAREIIIEQEFADRIAQSEF